MATEANSNYLSSRDEDLSTDYTTSPSVTSIHKEISIIVATAPKNVIGSENKLPWKISKDLQYFKNVTCGDCPGGKSNAIIMGRKTYESIPKKLRPLKDRINIVISSTLCEGEVAVGVVVKRNLDEVVQYIEEENIHKAFIIGGQQVYQEALAKLDITKIYMTRIGNKVEGDTYFPAIPKNYKLQVVSKTQCEGDYVFDFCEYCKVQEPNKEYSAVKLKGHPDYGSHEELQYLRLISHVMEKGTFVDDRTGVGTKALFGAQMRFDLTQSFPLLTTKRVYWKGVVEELLWFINGCTDGKVLSEKGVKIWDGNGSRQFLDDCGFYERDEGDLGPVYGFQWRHIGAKYVDKYTNYSGQGFDQLGHVIANLKSGNFNGRMVVTAWNPLDIEKMALPPCHMFLQFYVKDEKLCCQMYQRSADLGLGVPFNIASYSLLTCMVAQVCNLQAYEFVHVIGDAHVYNNHFEPLKEQLSRAPQPFPKLKMNPNVTDIDSFKFEDFELVGYNPLKKIEMKMAV